MPDDADRTRGERAARALLVAVILSALSGAGTAGEPEPPYFGETTTVSMVEVPVQVLARGRPVRGLQAADFVLLDNGTPRDLTTFEIIDLELAAPADTPLPSLAGRRKFLLLFDLVFTSPWDVARAERAARRLVQEDLAPSDLVAIGCFSSRRGLEIVLNFTADRQRALEVLDGLAFLLGGERDEPADKGALAARRDPLRLSTAGWNATLADVGRILGAEVNVAAESLMQTPGDDSIGAFL